MTKRVYGLDNWRAILLILGPVVHSAYAVSTRYGGVRWLETVGRASHLFRMETFFAIAGFLAAHSQMKSENWLKRRFVQLGLPLASTWVLVLLPIGLWLVRDVGAGPQHLWFLITLLAVSLPFYSLDKAGRLSFLEHRSFSLWLWGAAVLICSLMARVAEHELKSYDNASLNISVAIVSFWPYYGVFYILGMAIFRNSNLKTYVLSINVWPWALGLSALNLAIFFRYQAWSVEGRHTTFMASIFMFDSLCGMLLCISIMASALKTDQRHIVMHRLTHSAYTVYLFHFPIVLLISWWWSDLNLGKAAEFALMSLLSFIVPVTLHETCIKRFKWAALLFNGKLDHRPRAQTQSAGGGGEVS
jgi:hypothetical protein